jgi:hypothetical protein
MTKISHNTHAQPYNPIPINFEVTHSYISVYTLHYTYQIKSFKTTSLPITQSSQMDKHLIFEFPFSSRVICFDVGMLAYNAGSWVLQHQCKDRILTTKLRLAVRCLFLGQLNNQAETVQHLCFNNPKFLFLKFCPVSCKCFIMCLLQLNLTIQVLLRTIHGTYQI